MVVYFEAMITLERNTNRTISSDVWMSLTSSRACEAFAGVLSAFKYHCCVRDMRYRLASSRDATIVDYNLLLPSKRSPSSLKIPNCQFQMAKKKERFSFNNFFCK